MIRIFLILFKSFRRIADSLEQLVRLYRLDLASRGINETNPTLTDDIEVTYGAKVIDPDDLDRDL